MRLDHQEMAGSGYTVATARVKKTSSREKVKVQDTCKIGTEIKNMHTNILEIDQVMGSRFNTKRQRRP